MTTAADRKPRVGIPYRTQTEELSNDRSAYEKYILAVREAGGNPVEISLRCTAADLDSIARKLDAIVLPGSPADVHPLLFKVGAHPDCAISDPRREATDFALLDHALAMQLPVLAICYGIQSLNVFLGGSLIQDIASEAGTQIEHQWQGRSKGVPEPFHPIEIEADSRLARMAGSTEALVNSSHHQSVLETGRNLRVVAQAPDGVVEAVEWLPDTNWILGVQWHPERLTGTTPLAQALFRELVLAAWKAPVQI
jgi:putative glutamine amidotransferase